MPFGLKPCCVNCKTSDAPIWRKNDKAEILCNSCANTSNIKPSVSIETPAPVAIKKENGGNGNNGSNTPSSGSNTRKSTRKPATKSKQFATVKGKSRRSIFKKSVSK